MWGIPSSDFPLLTASNFEISLASDDLLAHFFNDFLSLPSFQEGLLYNPETRLFEVATDEAELVCRRIRSVLRRSKSQLLTGDPADLCSSPPVDNRYTVTCLDREQGIQWMIRERLPLFLLSDCYSEYRLAKLFQQEFKVFIQRLKFGGRSIQSAPQLRRSSKMNEGNVDMRRLQMCSKSAEDVSVEDSGSGIKDLTCQLPEHERSNITNVGSSSSPEPGAPSSNHPKLHYGEVQEPKFVTMLPSVGNREERQKECSNHGYRSVELQHECLVSTVDSRVFNNAETVMEGPNQTTASADVSRSAEQTACTGPPGPCECQAPAVGCRETLEGREGKVQEGTGGVRVEERAQRLEAGSGGLGQKNAPYICFYGICCHGSRPGLDDFKEFLHGRPGEKTFNLWMDIERLKLVQNRERKNRYLALMRGWYLLSSSRTHLPAALLSPLGLNTSPCWTEENLRSVQPNLTESLLHYWAPRFWMSQRFQRNFDDSPHGRFGKDQRLITEPPLDSLAHRDSATLQAQLSIHTQLSGGRGPLLSSTCMETMLEALNADGCAGSYFTTFCEQSGNQLWENAAHFWADLQNYRELFYQDGLDPYRVQREAQLLYSTYLLSSARRTIGVDEEISTEVHRQMMPAFEELFDEVEQHVLNILLEPWTRLVTKDKESFQKVCVWKDARSVNSQEYQELQSLFEDSQLQLKQLKDRRSPRPPPPSSAEGPLLSDLWSSVPPSYRGYRLDSLFRHHHEIRHFKSFLQDQDAGVHLSCWLDLEQYRKTGQKERWSQIANNYLNGNYFFGQESPATTQQQDDLLHLAGGLERLQLDPPSDPVVLELQDIVRSHIEKTWLPRFLSTAEFSGRQKHQLKLQAAGSLSHRLYRRRRARRAAWKAEGLWMSSSKEILLFRRILLNPTTCLQFQHFVGLKGGFLENDVLFWQEVQRYKNLCHSHSDEATIQQKISTIINCFISSSMPPALQVDVPPEQAQQILKKRRELGPYIFREAQMSVFSQLLKFWPEFQELRKGTQEEQFLPLLQEKRLKHAARVRRRRRKEEEEEEESRRAQEELEGPHSGYSEEEETGDEEGRSEERRLKMQSSKVSATPIKSLSWSYSKYMAALKREEVLLKKQMQASFSSASDSSSDSSVLSGSSKVSHVQSSWRSTDHKRDKVDRK
ncbi:regulator of G-protein signaling 22 isoform X2 [Takifugu flavidus]|uniref:regulator of G-protein signaling 22 isoform X2 n=1 Tax=Takifugu flavidus TaxID=433684 RepID=UPI0025449CB9|nr:regulator of G-protein signaling 22 isoform X2 [Takifugu flavidus]